MSEDKGKIVTLRLTEELHRQAKKLLPDDGVSFQSLLEGWIGEWVSGKKGAPAKPQPVAVNAAKGPHARWHIMLDEVLNDEDEREGIEKNLKWAATFIRKKAPKSKRA